MPAVGFIGEDGNKYDFETALEMADVGDSAFESVPYPLLKGMYESLEQRGDYISATSIIHCLRAHYLKSRTDYYVDPSKLYPSFRGKLFHGLLEEHGQKNSITEKKFTRVWRDKIEIGGTPDSLELYETGDLPNGKTHILTDWKTSAEIPKYGPWKDHILQLNIYRYILGLDPDKIIMRITYLTMQGFTTFRLKDGTQRGRAGAKPVNQHMTDDEIDKYLEDRLVKLRTSFLANMPVPYDMTTEEDRRLCGWCEVKAMCDKRAVQEREAQWKRDAGLPPDGPSDQSPLWEELLEGVKARVLA